jgi:5-methylcytosine-specific restriction endonuclease McrA
MAKKRKLTDKQKKEKYLRKREYMKVYQNKWLNNRRLEWVKANGPCKKCGTWENLEIDHIDPSQKSFRIASIWSRSKEFRDKELSKCQVLCKSCHFEKTTKENKEFGHGTPIKYATCKCVVCNQMKKFDKKKSKLNKSLS